VALGSWLSWHDRVIATDKYLHPEFRGDATGAIQDPLTIEWQVGYQREVRMGLHEELCPVAETLLGRLYRSSPEGVTVLIKSVPPQTRALLALYCFRRAHLEGLSRTIAATCSEHELRDAGGSLGSALFFEARQSQTAIPLQSRKGVTLASGRLWNPPPFED